MPDSLTEVLPAARLLYPRLTAEVGRGLIASRQGKDLEELAALSELSHQRAAPAPTGGSPATDADLARVRTSIREAAAAAGYPQTLRRGEEQSFDRPCGTALFEAMRIVPADAASEDVWTFLTLVVVPEIGPWRFGDTEERLLGRPRNVLRRLWWRAWALGPDLVWAPDGCRPLGEDEFVNIMERPSIGGNPRIAAAVRDVLWGVELEHPGLARSELMRSITRRFRAFLPHVCVESLSDDDLHELLAEVAAKAVGDVEGFTF